MMVNKIDRPNTTPTVRAMCTFAVYFSVCFFFFFFFFCRFTLVYEGPFVQWNPAITKYHGTEKMFVVAG